MSRSRAKRHRARATLGPMSANPGFAAAESLLLNAKFEDSRPLWWSSNYVYLAQMTGPDGEQFAAVYKPGSGERPLWDFPDGLYRREVAAYQLSQLLGWDFIPPTVLRQDAPSGPGSLQLFVSHDQACSFFEQREKTELVPQLKRMAVFDYVANNADRKGGHCLLGDEGRVWGIDHGLTFHEEYKLRTVIWDWADTPIADEWLADIERLAETLTCPANEADGLRSLLDSGEVEMTVSRIRKLLTTRKFPLPGPHRPYPWPLV